MLCAAEPRSGSLSEPLLSVSEKGADWLSGGDGWIYFLTSDVAQVPLLIMECVWTLFVPDSSVRGVLYLCLWLQPQVKSWVWFLLFSHANQMCFRGMNFWSYTICQGIEEIYVPEELRGFPVCKGDHFPLFPHLFAMK